MNIDAIKTLIEKSKTSPTSGEALEYAQAALLMSNIMINLDNLKKETT